uniref:Peptidase M12B propeptide domain-containing protein n=1 Tax=Spermophilus dauricus TaxID=99837 RepID=A0A8C9QRC3_SPEDA
MIILPQPPKYRYAPPRLAFIWALVCWELVGLGQDSLSPLLGNPAGFMEEQQARPERAPSGPSEPQILQDKAPIGLAEVFQTGLSKSMKIKVELDGDSYILELLQNRDLVPGRPTLAWYQPDGTRVVSEGHTLENCCHQGRVQGHTSSWVSMCACSGLRGLVVLSPERSYVLELGPGDIQGPPIISRIQDLRLPGHICALSRNAPVPTQAPPGQPLGQRHIRRVRRNVEPQDGSGHSLVGPGATSRLTRGTLLSVHSTSETW